MLHADIELEQFIQAHYMPESEEDLLVRLHRYNNVIGCMHYVCSHSFRDGQGREAWLAISSAATTLRLDGLRGKVPRLMLSLMLISPLAAKAALKAKYILHKQ